MRNLSSHPCPLRPINGRGPMQEKIEGPLTCEAEFSPRQREGWGNNGVQELMRLISNIYIKTAGITGKVSDLQSTVPAGIRTYHTIYTEHHITTQCPHYFRGKENIGYRILTYRMQWTRLTLRRGYTEGCKVGKGFQNYDDHDLWESVKP